MSRSREQIEFGPFRLDVAKRVLWRGTEIMALPPKAVDVLVALLEQAGDVVHKDQLMEQVWPDTFVEEANLSVNVSILRKALGAPHGGGAYVQTVPRRGYRFAAPVRRLTPASSAPPSLAVLPFTLLGPAEEEHAYLGLAMADALITRLGRFLEVRPTGAVARYAGTDPVAAGRGLHVDAVLEGKLQQQAGRLRVTVQLVPLSEALDSWADAFEADFNDIFAVQDAVAEKVARALALTLGREDPARVTTRHTPPLAAYHAYARGRYFWSRLSGAWVEKAFSAFQEAAALDPAYALPHAGLADVQAVLGFSGLVDPRLAWPLAEAAARRALELDDSVADAHVCLAYMRLFRDWDWTAAEEHLQRALDVPPPSAAVHQWHAVFLDLQGRLEEALQAVLKAQQLDPLSLIGSTLLGLQHNLQRRYDLELQQCLRSVELHPHEFLGHWGLGLAYEHQGRPEEAVRAHETALRLADGMGMLQGVLARSLALAGRVDESRRRLAALEGTFFSSYQRATVHVALGENEKALDCLELACRQRDPWVVWLDVDPMLDGLRAQRRFARLRQEVFAGRAGGS